MAALKDLVPKGWSLVGEGRPIEELDIRPNPAAQGDLRDPAAPPTISVGTGRYYVIVQDPEGRQRALFIKAQPIPSWEEGKPPIEAPITGSGQKPESTFKGDLRTLQWDQAGPIADVPRAADQASALNDWILADEQGTPIPPGNPEGKRPAYRIDPRNPTNRIAIPDPAKDPQGQVTTFGNDLVLVTPDGTVTTLRTKPAAAETINVPGIGVVRYDPATDTTKIIQPAAPEKPEVLDPSKVIWQDIPGTDQQQAHRIVDGKMQPIEGYTRPASEGRATTLLNDPNSRYLIWVNDRGQEVARLEKPGWQAPREALTPNTVVGELPFYNLESGRIEWQPNQNQIKASQAVSDLAKSLGMSIAAGSMSEDQAQNLITAAVNSMNARTSALTGQVGAAGETLSQIQQGAQTGAGILQNRVSETRGLIEGLGGQLMQRQAPMLNIPSEESMRGMIQGATGMVTELGGGPGVYEAAANLVQRADPANRLGADAAGMYAGLADAMGKFQQLTGRLPPLAQAAAQPMPQGVGFNPGVATPQPNPAAQPPPGMPKRIVQPKRPQAPMPAFAGLGSTTPGAAWNQNQLTAGMAQQAAQRGAGPGMGGWPAPVTININSPS